jgi:hypothetical protein
MTTQLETEATQGLSSEQLLEDSTSINYVDEIEMVIAGMAEDQKVMVGQSKAGHLWKFTYGTVEVFVQLTGTSEQDMFTVWSSVLPLPAKHEEKLMRLLLEMNWGQTWEARYAIVDNQVVVLSSRTVEDLSPVEISRTITIVATLADDSDEPLMEEFGLE